MTKSLGDRKITPKDFQMKYLLVILQKVIIQLQVIKVNSQEG